MMGLKTTQTQDITGMHNGSWTRTVEFLQLRNFSHDSKGSIPFAYCHISVQYMYFVLYIRYFLLLINRKTHKEKEYAAKISCSLHAGKTTVGRSLKGDQALIL